MASDDNPQFRITASPGVPLLQPRYRRHAAYRFDRTGEVLIPDGEPLWTTASGETYLQLIGLDIDDPSAVLAFANKYGLLEGGFAYGDLSRLGFMTASVSFERHLALMRQVAETDADYRVRQQVEGAVPLETLDLFRFTLRVFRDLTNAWRAFREGIDADTIHWEFRSSAPTGIEYAAFLLDYVLPQLLTTFRPSVRIEYPGMPGDEEADPDAAWTEFMTVEASRGPSLPWLYQLCALELYNHIVENATYQTCRNETCGRPFVRQLGRAEHGQSRREGVMYCTWACANAQAQRNYRRRKRAQASSAVAEP